MVFLWQRFNLLFVNVFLVLLLYVIVFGNFYTFLLNRSVNSFIPSEKKIWDDEKSENYTNFNNLNDWSPSLTAPFVTVICNKMNTEFIELKDSVYSEFLRQIEQFRVMIGTLLYFSHSTKWRIIVITDSQESYDKLVRSINKYPSKQLQRLKFERYSISVPNTLEFSDLLQHYRPCAWQKLFLEHILPQEDAVIFADSDVLFTGPAEDLWNVFNAFHESQSIALGPEPWYVKDDDRPYAGQVGLNTGVMAMNLTKLRLEYPGNRSFGHRVTEEIDKAPMFPRHDQDMVNQFLCNRTHLLFELTYKWNFIPSDCSEYAPNCTDCVTDGISVVHGADASFYRAVDGKIMALYRTMEKLTRELRTPPDILLLLLLGRSEGATLIRLDSICQMYESFVPMVTHHLKKMVANYNSSNKIDFEKYI